MDLGSLALLLKGISAWLETPNLDWVAALLGVGAALRTEGGLAGPLVLADMLGLNLSSGGNCEAGKTELLREAAGENT